MPLSLPVSLPFLRRVLCPSRQHARRFSQSQRLCASWGFIGLGRMGFQMARNLRLKTPPQDSLYVYDVNPKVQQQFRDSLRDHDVRIAASVREVAEHSVTVFTSLPDPDAVRLVYNHALNHSDVNPLPRLEQPRLFIDTSTIDLATSAECASLIFSASAGHFVDAPMSGGQKGAQNATLTFMLGAPNEILTRATKALSPMAANIFHMGPLGSGLKAKLANNYLLAINNVATSEAFYMGISLGLDKTKLAALINSSTGRCWPSAVNNPVPGVIDESPASRGYQGGFATSLMYKDLTLALKACHDANIKLALAEPVKQVYGLLNSDSEYRSKDFSAVFDWLAKQNSDR